MDLCGKPMLRLISRLNSIDNIKWIRFCTAADFINKKFIDNIFANNKLLHYIDIPLSMLRECLRRMGRSQRDEYLEMINMLRREYLTW